MFYTVIKHSGHLKTLEKCRKHSPAARVFYVSLVFSNARRVLSQCNTRLRLLYLLITIVEIVLYSDVLYYKISLVEVLICDFTSILFVALRGINYFLALL